MGFLDVLVGFSQEACLQNAWLGYVLWAVVETDEPHISIRISSKSFRYKKEKPIGLSLD